MPPLPYTPTQLLNDPDYQDGITTHFIAATSAYAEYLGTWKNVQLNEQLLFEAIASTYCDIYRLQVFRGIKHEDIHKRSAFLMKWINKFRPVQIVTGTITNMSTDILANEIFATCVALTILNIDPHDFFTNDKLTTYSKNIVYLLRYHSHESEQLASELYLFTQHANSNWASM